MHHMFSKHLNACTCLKNLSIKSTKHFFQVKSSEYTSREYAVFEKCDEENIKEIEDVGWILPAQHRTD